MAREVPMAGEGVERPLAARSAAKRDAVLDAAQRLFASVGFHKTGMRDLAREAGVSTATIYAHFPNKQRLLEELVTERLRPALALSERFERIADGREPPEKAFELFVDTIRALNRHFAQDPLLRGILAWDRHVSDRRIAARAHAVERCVTERSAAALERLVADGRLALSDPTAAAHLVSLCVQGWIAWESRRELQGAGDPGPPLPEPQLTDALVELLRACARSGEELDG
ncbi:MAG: TetR/AcrR family transcriptional regulator [Myxococcota bacterium]